MKTDRIPALDGLRGIAILLVVISHVPGWGFAQFGGAVGVQLFFVLSGFLITRILIAEVRQTGTVSLRSFWLRRAARLLPAIIVLIVGFVPVALFLGETSAWLRNSLLGASYQASFILSGGGSLGVVDHMWSLAVEEWFYLVWPFVIVVLARRVPGRGFVSAIAGIAGTAIIWKVHLNVSVPYERSYFSIDGNAFALLGGAVTAALAHRTEATRSNLALNTAVAVIVVFALAPDLSDNARAILWGTLLLMPISAVAVWYAQRGSKILESGVLRWFGRVSYSLYLWHLPLLEAPILVEMNMIGRTVLLLSVATLVSALSTVVVEEPVVVRAKRWWASREHSFGSQRPTAFLPSLDCSPSHTRVSGADDETLNIA